jgi:hypothetical protein
VLVRNCNLRILCGMWPINAGCFRFVTACSTQCFQLSFVVFRMSKGMILFFIYKNASYISKYNIYFAAEKAVTNYNIVHFLCDVNMTSNITYIILPERSDGIDLCVCVCMQLVTFAELNNSYWIICPPWVICVIVITSMQSILRGCTQLSQVMWKLFNK